LSGKNDGFVDFCLQRARFDCIFAAVNKIIFKPIYFQKMMETKNYSSHHCISGLTFSILIIVTGLLLLLCNFDTFGVNMRPVLLSWPTLIIVLGVWLLCWKHFISGAFTLLFGAFFLLPRLAAACPYHFGWVPDEFVKIYWPLLLIILGVCLVLHLLLEKKHPRYHWNKNYHHKVVGSTSKDGFIERSVVFSGIEEIMLDPVFSGGNLSCVFGGIVLDLRKTTLPEGDNFLDIYNVFGGVVLEIPDTWHVEFRTSNVLGGAVDSRKYRDKIDITHKLIITGSSVLGGVEVK
jgi:predicted membrane protein